MSWEASQVVSNPLFETLRIIVVVHLLMRVIGFSELIHDYGVRRKISAKLYEVGSKNWWRTPH